MKTIPDFPNYAIAKSGKVWTKERKDRLDRPVKGKWLKPDTINSGHKRVILCKNNKTYRRFIHRLVLETYIGKCPKGMECRHLDGNPKNNKLSNLKWGTRSDNGLDAVKHKTCYFCSGENHPNTKLTNQLVRMIVYMYRTGLFSQKEIADIYNISKYVVYSIIHKRTWKHIWIKF